jgi:hypothetical protein
MFDEFGCPVECDDVLEWSRFVAAVTKGRIGAHENIVGQFHVNTYFVGLDLRGRFPWGPEPLVWETWVSEITGADRLSWPQVDYFGHVTRWAAAIAHRQIVSEMRRGTYKPTGRQWVYGEKDPAPSTAIT